MNVVITLLKRIRHRPAVRMSSIDNHCIRTTRTQNAQFVSFLAESGFRRVNPDRYEQSLRRRKIAKMILFWVSAMGASWVVLESARALSLF